MLEITFLSVLYKNHKLFEYNLSLINNYNPLLKLNFLIIDNSPDGDYDIEYLMNNKNVEYIKNSIIPDSKIKINSFHHSYALDIGINHIKADKLPDLLFIIDPDFFVFGKNWINSIYEIMYTERLFVFGAPWGKKWVNKYKSFPCVQFIAFKSDLIPSMPSFSPFDESLFIHSLIWKLSVRSKIVSKVVPYFVDHIVDTGSQVYSKFKKFKNFVINEISFTEFNNRELFNNELINPELLNKFLANKYSAECFNYKSIYAIHFRSFGNN